MNLEQNIANIKSEEYRKYLDFYYNFHQERVKCLKRKNCKDQYIETVKELKIIKGTKEKKLSKPKYVFVYNRIKEINLELNEMENGPTGIRNFRFIVETDSSKKVADSFGELKKKFQELTNEKKELKEYLIRANNLEENKEKQIEINAQILDEKNKKRLLYFEIQQYYGDETKEEERNALVKEYVDNANLKKLAKELNKLNKTEINYIITDLPTKTKTPEKSLEEKDKKKKKIVKRCPKGEKKDKKTGECVKKDE